MSFVGLNSYQLWSSLKQDLPPINVCADIEHPPCVPSAKLTKLWKHGPFGLLIYRSDDGDSPVRLNCWFTKGCHHWYHPSFVALIP